MRLRIGGLALVIGLVVSQRTAYASEPPVPEGIVVYHDIPYREGPSRQWKLDLAMKKEKGRQAETRHRGDSRGRMAGRG